MGKKGLGPRSSGAQLWTEVQRLRRTGDDERVAELTTEVERARAREKALVSELGAARGRAGASGIIDGESFAGKPALAKLSASWDDFADAVMRMPETRHDEGFRAIRETVATKLARDLTLFNLDPPRSRTEGRERDRLRRYLASPPYLRCLSTEGEWGDRFRATFLEQVVRSYVRPSVWRIYEKASDEGIRDGLGTVYK